MEPELELRLGICPFCAGGLLLCTIIGHTTDWEIVFSIPYPFWPMLRNMFYLMTQYTHMCKHVFYLLNPYPRMCFYCFEREGGEKHQSAASYIPLDWRLNWQLDPLVHRTILQMSHISQGWTCTLNKSSRKHYLSLVEAVCLAIFSFIFSIVYDLLIYFMTH